MMHEWGWVWAGVAALAVALALPGGPAVAPEAALVGAGIGAVLGCMTCAGAGIMWLLSGGTLATVLWSKVAFSASAACLGVCIAAVS